MKWPTSQELTETLLTVLRDMGGSGTASEIDKAVVSKLNLSVELLALKRDGNRGEIQYRLAWVRTKAKQKGLISRESNRVWKLN